MNYGEGLWKLSIKGSERILASLSEGSIDFTFLIRLFFKLGEIFAVNSSGFNHPCQCLISIGQLARSSNFLDNFFLSLRLEDILIANF